MASRCSFVCQNKTFDIHEKSLRNFSERKTFLYVESITKQKLSDILANHLCIEKIIVLAEH